MKWKRYLVRHVAVLVLRYVLHASSPADFNFQRKFADSSLLGRVFVNVVIVLCAKLEVSIWGFSKHTRTAAFFTFLLGTYFCVYSLLLFT